MCRQDELTDAIRPGEDKCHPGPKISEQSPVLTRYRKRIRGNIARYSPSCGGPLGEAKDYKLPSSSSESPWRIPIWREIGKKKAVVRRRISQVLTTAVVLVMVCPHEMAALRILIGGGVAALTAT
jgi:hypothetical protein